MCDVCRGLYSIDRGLERSSTGCSMVYIEWVVGAESHVVLVPPYFPVVGKWTAKWCWTMYPFQLVEAVSGIAVPV